MMQLFMLDRMRASELLEIRHSKWNFATSHVRFNIKNRIVCCKLNPQILLWIFFTRGFYRTYGFCIARGKESDWGGGEELHRIVL